MEIGCALEEPTASGPVIGQRPSHQPSVQPEVSTTRNWRAKENGVSSLRLERCVLTHVHSTPRKRKSQQQVCCVGIQTSQVGSEVRWPGLHGQGVQTTKGISDNRSRLASPVPLRESRAKGTPSPRRVLDPGAPLTMTCPCPRSLSAFLSVEHDLQESEASALSVLAPLVPTR